MNYEGMDCREIHPVPGAKNVKRNRLILFLHEFFSDGFVNPVVHR